MEQCRKCKQSCMNLMIHRCPPRWRCRVEDDDEWFDIYNETASDAACEFTEQYYGPDGIKDVTIVVEAGDGTQARYDVTLDFVPTYYATKVKE